MEADLDTMHGDLAQETGLAMEHLHFFDSLHCSPIKVRKHDCRIKPSSQNQSWKLWIARQQERI